MVFSPYAVDAPMCRTPVANFVILGVTVLLTFLFWQNQRSMFPYMVMGSQNVYIGKESKVIRIPGSEYVYIIKDSKSIRVPAGELTNDGMLILPASNALSWIGHMFAHAGFFHLLSNMIFLYLFGNAVCAKLGNLRYLLFYLLGGIAAAMTQLVFSPGAMIGASGAINAVVGAYLLLFPRHKVHCWFLIFFRPITYSVPGVVAILTWFVFDLWGVYSGGDGRTGYVAHIGGFLFGAAIMTLMLKCERLSYLCSRSYFENR